MFNQSFQDKILKHLKGQCATIKKREPSRTKIKASDEIQGIHNKAEKNIDSKSKLLIMPHTKMEKRKSPNDHKKREKDPNVVKDIRRKNFNKSQSSVARKCKFKYHKLGQFDQIHECDLEGRTVVVKWNIDHPFYQRFVLDQRSDDRLVTAVDYLICSMASAELYFVDEDNLDLFVAMKIVMSANVRTLLI
ncbi:MAG TPA: hypothetical protein EYQ26_14385 [Rhodospirillales bacterium]|nr:hypothetical protein [Rhodospirillales bacterium]